MRVFFLLLFSPPVSSPWPPVPLFHGPGNEELVLLVSQEDVSEYYTIFVLMFQASMGFSVVKARLRPQPAPAPAGVRFPAPHGGGWEALFPI